MKREDGVKLLVPKASVPPPPFIEAVDVIDSDDDDCEACWVL